MFVALIHKIAWIPLRFLFWLFADYQVSGIEKIREVRAPAIFISNHHGPFDPFLIGIGLPWLSPLHGVRWLTRDEEFNRPIRRHTLRLFGAFPGKILSGYNEALKQPLRYLARGISVGVFPDWCYQGDALCLARMHYIAPLLAKKTSQPVIPVFLYGVHDVTWWRLFTRQLKIQVMYGMPYYPQERAASMQVYDEINKLLFQAKWSYLHEVLHEGEKTFWEEYGKFYHYLERADAYNDLIADFRSLLPETVKGTWLDVGSGSGKVLELLLSRANKYGEGAHLIASDHNQVMLQHLKGRFQEKIAIREIDLVKRLPFEDETLDGISANLVLPYIVH
ncbi:MAG: methyltransferase domain-containing protein, partial [Candidatus Sungbacteria bacterium]|nr:methyltransferase domain-containing protein [Candidatus Sungbacteria bacterium]